jgi:hypothetical protein
MMRTVCEETAARCLKRGHEINGLQCGFRKPVASRSEGAALRSRGFGVKRKESFYLRVLMFVYIAIQTRGKSSLCGNCAGLRKSRRWNVLTQIRLVLSLANDR